MTIKRNRLKSLGHLLIFSGCALSLSACSLPLSLAASGGGFGLRSAMEERTMVDIGQDSRIRLSLIDKISRDPDLSTHARVQVFAGQVLLAGNLVKAEDFEKAQRLAFSVAGVQTLHNELSVTPGDSGFFDRNRDIYLQKRIGLALLTHRAVASLNYSVMVVDRKAYMLGLATSLEEKAQAISVAKSIVGRDRVVEHIKLSEES